MCAVGAVCVRMPVCCGSARAPVGVCPGCHGIEPQHMPSVAAEAFRSMPMVHCAGRAAARKRKTDRNLQPVSCGDLCPLLKYAVCKVYSLVFFLVYDFRVYLRSLYFGMS